ncbi:MAG: cytochrome c biogenesis protein CcsA [Acidobacteria bacterium]|nr:cytochrome c biogenesis protein CcsA [Acidobacteriota bacterium]
MVVKGLHGAFLEAPTEKVMGDVQRIFYFHAPAGIIAFLAFAVTGVASLLYLWKRALIFDVVAHASAEIGLLFCTIVLVTGPLWARPVWGTWWTWEARLTMTLVLWLIYVSYVLVRRYTDSRDQQARFSAVLGIVGALDIYIVYRSVTWWRGLHPVVLQPSGGGGLDPDMRVVFVFCIFVYLMLYACLMAIRIPIGTAEDELAALQEQHARRRNA